MMQVQKGLVKYKDRSDIICTYGIADDGKQYYFIDGEKSSSNRIIVSTALVEAIDPLVVASNIGVIDSDSNMIIPFENKSIKSILDSAFLVEKVNPTTPSVIEACDARKDPLLAARLVTTPATIKDKMNAMMGNGGRYLFNDQFSEATVYDLDGNNILNNEYYSFIGLNNNTLYLSKNIPESEVIEVVLGDEKQKQDDSINSEMKDEKSSEETVVNDTPIEEDNRLNPVDFQKIEMGDDFPDEVEDEDNDNLNFDGSSDSKNTNLKEENISDDNGDSDFSENELDEKNENVLDDATSVITRLIEQNKKQKDLIKSCEKDIESLDNTNEKILKENEDLKDKLSKALAEIEELKIQTGGKQNLAKVIDEAEDLLNSDQSNK